MSYLCTIPSLALLPCHRSKQIHLLRIFTSIFGWPATDEYSAHRTIVLMESPNVLFPINIEIIIEITQTTWTDAKRHCKHAECILKSGYTVTEKRPYPTALLYQTASLRGMNIADKKRSFIAFAIGTDGVCQATIFLHQFLHLGITNDFTSQCTDTISQCIDNQRPTAFQAPTALDKATVSMQKGKQRKRLFPEFHLQRGSAKNIDQQRILKILIQVFPSTDCHVFRQQIGTYAIGIESCKLLGRRLFQ